MSNTFDLTPDHIALLRRMNVGWQNCESGAPEIDPKRPYGNSGVTQDVLEILKVPPAMKCRNCGDEWDTAQEEHADAIHRQTETALQIVLCTGEFKPGRYLEKSYGQWVYHAPLPGMPDEA